MKKITIFYQCVVLSQRQYQIKPNVTAQLTHQRPVYKLHIIRCGIIITFAL